MFLTGLGLVVLWCAVSFLLIKLGISAPLVALIMLGAIFCQYWFSDRVAMFSMHAREVTAEQEPQLHAIVDRLCAMSSMPKPRVAVAEVDVPNAFATGRTPKRAVVCATRGIMKRLPDEELEAVLAHEMSHVAHRDVAVMTIASSVGMLAGLISRMAMFGAFFGRGGRSGGNMFFLEMITWLVSIAVYIVSFLLTLSLSRHRELLADRSGAILIGKPSVLASALVRVSNDMGRIPTRDLRRVEGMNAFFFAPAFTKGSTASILSTHPSLSQRLDQLAKLEKQLNG
jgi:heat shock protein HtpX